MPKNIVHVLSSFKVGGAERLVLDLAQVQRNHGDQVAVFSCHSGREALLEEVDSLDVDGILSSGDRIADYRLLLRRFPSGADGAVFHIHSPAALRYLGPIFPLLKWRGVSIIYTRHGVAPLERKVWGLVHRWARFFVDRVTFVSAVGLQVFHKRFSWPKRMLQTISNGVFIPDLKTQESYQERVLRIGSVGRMVALKAQTHLLQVLADIQSEQSGIAIEIHFFGDGPERQALETEARESLKPDTAVFHGMQLDRDKVYSNLDLLVVCSEQEGLSLAIMEAMAREIPVIATAVGDSPKLVIDNQTGRLYPYAELAELKRCLLDILQNPDYRKKLGQGARRHMMENYSLEKTNNAYQSVY